MKDIDLINEILFEEGQYITSDIFELDASCCPECAFQQGNECPCKKV